MAGKTEQTEDGKMENSRGKRLLGWMLCACLALAMMIVLLPAQEAKADYHIGDPCPVTGCEGLIKYDACSPSHHHFVCSLHPDDTHHLFISEPHFGGTATCMGEGKCEGCGKLYIDVDLNNHDWVLDTTQGDGGWEWAVDGGSAAVHLKCQRGGCGDYATVTDNAPVPSNITYDAGTGKVSKTLTATVTMANGQAFSATKNVQTDPIAVNCVYYAAGVYYLDMPDSVPEQYNCHYGVGWWMGAKEFNKVMQTGGNYYLAANVNTLDYEAIDSFINEVKGTPATCTDPGVADYWKCTMCGKKYSEAACVNEIQEPVAIDALGHDLKETKKVEPTCTEDGTEAYWTCRRDGCGKMFSDEEGEHEIDAPVVIPAKGHTPADAVKEHEKAAEAGVAGSYDEVVYCAACGTELSRKTVETDPLPEPNQEEAEPLVSVFDETGAVELRFFPEGIYTVRLRGMWAAYGRYTLENEALTLEAGDTKTAVREDRSLGFTLGEETYSFLFPEDALAILSGEVKK